jgi:ArsR family transcriptional regulator, lead/cadmium/zinc/bismuth-responsive transcriptional repressor
MHVDLMCAQLLHYYTRSCNSRSVSRKSCCPPKPSLTSRPLICVRQAQALESTFKLLANTTRLRMLHALASAGELCVGELAEKLCMKPQAISNQLQRLADRGIVEAQRNGLQIRYSIVDPCVLTLLHQGWCLAEDAQVRAFERLENEAS